MSDLYEYQAIDGSSKGPVSLVLLIQARNHGRLSNRTMVRKLPAGGWQPLSSFIPSMTVMDADMEESAMPEPETGFEPAIPAWTRKKYWMRIIKGWCSFEGRAGKQEMREVYSIVGVAWLAVAGGPAIVKSGFFSVSPMMELFFPLAYVVLPVLFLPLAATMVRRLHDVGKSGLSLIWLAVPVVGWLLLLYLCYGESLPGENKYGEPPWN
ncbi:DUF805 domain-containing protein [Akkermansia muciniphila]|uniref:DUF805 domain-containing protein n=1 Tax=Akkermansia muciniphila TaxID=239935 RepID=UPI000C9C7179|nr:DUF805 domain-containing protein [Akkermansia muciniphila]PNC04856.1 hypothetical protein CXU21_06755 [Akkermansia muciniphila]